MNLIEQIQKEKKSEGKVLCDSDWESNVNFNLGLELAIKIIKERDNEGR